jgi:hypothetical protein
MRFLQRGATALLASGVLLALSATAFAAGPDETPPDCASAGTGGCGELGDAGDDFAPDGAGPPDDAGLHEDGGGAIVEHAPGVGVVTLTLPAHANGDPSAAFAAHLAHHASIQAHVTGIQDLIASLQESDPPTDRATVARALRTSIHSLLLGLTGILPNDQALFSVLGGVNASA